MRTEGAEVKEQLFAKEEQLLKNDIRTTPDKIAELVDEDCVEINETGRQHAYKRGETFESIDGVLFIMSDSLRVVDLSADCKLVLYVASKVKKNTRMKSSCSSVWKNKGGNWKVIFHQRTACLE
jgi:hypothetical protein